MRISLQDALTLRDELDNVIISVRTASAKTCLHLPPLAEVLMREVVARSDEDRRNGDD
jgi:hypothetical protein